MPLQHAESLSFFDLPGEVRNQIYKLYLKDLGWGRRRAMCLAQPALTRVNRAVREETLEMFYTHDNFEICIRANVHNEEYDRRAFRHCLRGIEATVRAGRFQLLSSLSICLIYAQNNTTSESSIDQIALRARIFNAETIITQRDGTGSFEVSPRSAFLAMDSVHNDFTQWNFLEDVEDAIAIHKQRLQKSYLEEDGDYDVYESLEEMPTDRLCKILQLLLGEPSMPEHFTRSITLYVPICIFLIGFAVADI